MNKWITLTAAIIISTAIAFLIHFGPSADGVEQLRATLLSYGPWAAVISASLTVGQAIIAPLPANVITISNGLVFGPLWGGILSWVSTLIGASLCFALAKWWGKPFAHRIVGKSLESAEGFFKKYGLPAIFLVRIVPFVPFDAISYGAGVVGVPYSRFLLATAVGIIPSTFIYSYIGSAVAGAYFWILLALLSMSLLGLLVASRYLRKPPLAPSGI